VYDVDVERGGGALKVEVVAASVPNSMLAAYSSHSTPKRSHYARSGRNYALLQDRTGTGSLRYMMWMWR